jgi:phenylalanine-4-hydroxylase
MKAHNILPIAKPAYIAKPVDLHGRVHYTAEENQVWQTLMLRHAPVVKDRACPEYLEGLRLLNLPTDRIAQLPEVSAILQTTTGWSLAPVPALIPFDVFFDLLSNKQFPVATFIRRREEIDYLQEPDIFHEIVGHCPLLTNPAYAAFTHTYGKLGKAATTHEEHVLLARLFWFTIEFGLINSPAGLRVYGGGILSSVQETVYSLESEIPERKPFDVMTTLRTSYKIDEIQKCYFILDHFEQLYALTNMDLLSMVKQVLLLGKKAPLHPC